MSVTSKVELRVVAPFAASVVKAPVERVVAPTVIPLIVPPVSVAAAELTAPKVVAPVTPSVPPTVALFVTAKELRVLKPDEAIVVADNAASVEAPVTPSVVAIDTEFSDEIPDDASVVNAPAAAVVPPMGVLLIVPPVSTGVLSTGEVRVFAVKVCVAPTPTNVSLTPGKVQVSVDNVGTLPSSNTTRFDASRLSIKNVESSTRDLFVNVEVELIVGTATPAFVIAPATARVVVIASPPLISWTCVPPDAPKVNLPAEFQFPIADPPAEKPTLSAARL